MKKLSTLFILVVASAHAQTLPFSKVLDKNQVHARINTVNDKFWNYYGNHGPAYEVPAGSGRHAMFANSLWIGGIDVGGSLHLAANTYKQNGTDFWPGPLDTTNAAAASGAAMSLYNKVWKVDCDDITSFVTAFNNGQVANGTYTVPADILSYPANGSGNFQRQMAPFFDADNDGIYDPQNDGDYPLIKGHQQILSIYNDNYNLHTETTALPLGIEIQERSFAFSDPGLPDSMQAVNYSTFYVYTIYNRSANRYNNVFISDWNDVDNGYYGNDFIGTDTINNFAYDYNDGPSDPSLFGSNGYGNKPPVSSLMLLPTNCVGDGVDNDNDGSIDEAGELFTMDRTTYYNNNIGSVPPQMTNPSMDIHYYNYMSGYWRDGTPFTYGGDAYGGTTNSHYVYTGDPQNASGWTEGTAGNTSGDRRILLSSGPFTLPAHGKIEWGYAVVFSQDTGNAVNTISQFQQRVQRDIRNVRHYYLQHQNPQCAPSVNPPVLTGISERTTFLSASLYPNPSNGYLRVELDRNVQQANVLIFDLLGREVMTSQIRSGYRTEFDLSTLPQGLYVVTVNSETGTTSAKLVKR